MMRILISLQQFFTMVVMLFNICNQSDFTRKQCLSDWDQWLYPEIHRAWNLMTNYEKPYAEERRVLESRKED